MIMQAQGELLPSLTFEMLRIVTKSDTILIKSDEAGVKSGCGAWVRSSDRPQRSTLGSLQLSRCSPRCLSPGCAGRRIGPDVISRKLILIGTSAVGLLDVEKPRRSIQ